MPHALLIDLARRAIFVALLVGAPMLITALLVGIGISVFQALTQIQEQTVAFVAKLIAVAIVFLVALPWILQVLVEYTAELFRGLPGLVS